MCADKAGRLQRLREAGDPQAKAAVALELLEPRYGLEVVQAALRALAAQPLVQARPGLRRLYAHYAAQGVARDPGTYVRSQIVRTLRPVAVVEDLDLLFQAVQTYEYPPPGFKEEAALLRAGALVALADLDETAARFHATRLLADARTDPMSGEPALSAVAVLAALGEVLPLWFYALQAHEHLLPEVAAECLRHLTAVPGALLPSLLAHYAETTQPVLLLGVVDLLIMHQEGPAGLEVLAGLLQRPPDLDLYRYLAAALLASGNPTLRTLLRENARLEQNSARVAVLLELLGELAENSEWAETVAVLRGRRRPRRT